ncbi:hypothetical protein ACTJKQ_12670 [Acidovorax sp. 22279]|uniref:hypothetical protein n=1 Tax=Acidovorax sp. 22279 TaxID=3453900 RepID=UPI003F875531
MGMGDALADVMLEGRARDAESSARFAQAEASRLKSEIHNLELAKIAAAAVSQRLQWKYVGQGEGFKALMLGFKKTAEKMLSEEQKRELFRDSIVFARQFIQEESGKIENLQESTHSAWTDEHFGWSAAYPFFEIDPPCPEPIAPTRPKDIETRIENLFFLIPYRVHFVGEQKFHKLRNAKRFYDSLIETHKKEMTHHLSFHARWVRYKEKYEEQQARIAEYSL